MTVWSKALSLFFWFMTPCGVSTGILSFGDGIVVGAPGGGCGIWAVLVELAFAGPLLFVFCLFVVCLSLSLSLSRSLALSLSFFSFLPLSLPLYGAGILDTSYFNSHFTWLMSQARM